jgi:hypothetical protein
MTPKKNLIPVFEQQTPIEFTNKQLHIFWLPEEIKVEKAMVDGAEYDEKTGILYWPITITPKQVVKKQLGYQVKYPKNKKSPSPSLAQAI